jgi:hypothetical protein
VDDVDDKDVVVSEIDAQEHIVDEITNPPEFERRSDAFKGFRGLSLIDVQEKLAVRCVCMYPGKSEVIGCLVLPERSLGDIATIFQDTAKRAVCKAGHGNCKFMLAQHQSLGISLVQVECDLVAWLAAGSTCDGAAHAQLANNVRRDVYSMKSRR